MTHEQAKTIAIERMKVLQLFEPCIEAFEKRDEVQMSEPTGGLYEISGEERLLRIIEKFEQKYNALVYNVIHTYTEFGELYNLLYVGLEEDEYELDATMKDLQDGYVFVWCENLDTDWCSEFGTIGVRNRFGGLVRMS